MGNEFIHRGIGLMVSLKGYKQAAGLRIDSSGYGSVIASPLADWVLELCAKESIGKWR